MIDCKASSHGLLLIASNFLRVHPKAIANWYKRMIAALIIMNVIDGILTLCWVFAKQVEEANPLMSMLIETDPVLFMVVKLALVHLGAALLWQWRSRLFAVLSTAFVFTVYGAIMLCHLMIV